MNSSLKTSAICLSAVLFSGFMAHAQMPPQNLVFTEQSSMVVTESLDGVSIGNWQVFDSAFAPEFILADSTTLGRLVGITVPGGGIGFDFLDPVNAGNFFFYNAGSDFIGTDVPGGIIGGNFYPVNGVSDFLPFSATGALVETANGPVPVNITVQGPQQGSVPDSGSSNMLLLTAISALALAKKFTSRANVNG
jgi:hypothetical protein